MAWEVEQYLYLVGCLGPHLDACSRMRDRYAWWASMGDLARLYQFQIPTYNMMVGCRVSDRQETEVLYPARACGGPEQINLPELS